MTTNNILSLCAKLHHFQKELKIIHVGGTNGKGSTSYELYQQLIHQGFKVGLYHSPFVLVRFDNIEINDQKLSNTHLLALLQQYEASFKQFQLTEFEIDTFIAYRYFYEQQVDYAVIEVGLGGLHDATNIMTPLISVLTSVGTDHIELIGPTVLDIAKEKSGIIKPHTPVVIGANFDPQVKQLIIEQASVLDAPFVELKSKQKFSSYLVHNQALAHLVLNTLGFEVLPLKHNTLPFRFERVNQFILDGAHNIEAVRALVEWIKKEAIQPVIIMSALKHKPYEFMFDMLKEVSIHLFVTSFHHDHAIQKFDLNETMQSCFIEFDELNEVFNKYPRDTILLTGSLYFLRSIHQCYKEIIYAKH
jgi:dihydrofolate synthase / folylpolyglutamate synthase